MADEMQSLARKLIGPLWPWIADRIPLQIGVWTPAFTGATVAGTFTYTIQAGAYSRIGNVVFISGRVAISAIPVAPTGAIMYITGLPFTSVGTTNIFGAVSFGYISSMNYAAGSMQLSGYIGPGQTRIEMVESFDNAAAAGLLPANFTNAAADLVFTGQYFV